MVILSPDGLKWYFVNDSQNNKFLVVDEEIYILLSIASVFLISLLTYHSLNSLAESDST